MKTSKFREAVFQMLWNQQVAKSDREDLSKLLMKELAITKKTCYQAWDRVQAILAKQEELDTLVESALTNYSKEELGKIESTVLCLSLYEILYDNEIPNAVAIDEAIRLQKKFGNAQAASLINACLDKIAKDAAN